MKRRRLVISFAMAAAAIMLLWLCCLPERLFGDTPYSTVVYAADGRLLGARVADDGQWRFPPADSLPPKFVAALVEYEDRTFRSHCGVSARGIGRAFWQNISHGRVVSGGSTITMQTVRLHRRGNRNIWEKAIEMFMATRLEWRYGKDEILALYASHAPFGGNVVGIGAAMWRYLGSDGADMSWAEAATLAVMQNAPSAMHLNKNRDKLLAKRNRLLKRLYDKGLLSAEEYELSVDEPLIGTPYGMPRVATHFVEYCHKNHHGQQISSHIDMDLQRRLESTASRWRSELSLVGAHDLAAVIVDVDAGDFVAYCGNADIDELREGAWVDIARAPRSSGSILKPLLYCAAMQEGIILENTLLPDIPTDFGGFAPKNFDGGYSGMVPARTALALSLNVPNVWLLKQYGVARFASLLRGCGLSTISKSPDSYGLSLVLGGAEVALADVTMCYARLARYDASLPLTDSTAIYSMLTAMREVNRPDELDWTRVASVQNVAWKTGTSYGSRDAWAIGITPHYVVGVWVGNADGSGVTDLTGARAAGPVMFDIFSMLPSSGWFEAPRGSMMRPVCRHSGHLAGPSCTDTVMQVVPAKAHLSGLCPYCRDGYFILPPVQKYFYKLSHADYMEPPASTTQGRDNMRFIYPSDGAVIARAHKIDGDESRLVCKATHTDPAAELFWHLDNAFIGATRDIHQVQIAPTPGVHRLTILDPTGIERSIEIVVK